MTNKTNDTDYKTKNRIKWTLLKQAKNTIWKNRFCLCCDIHFETYDNFYKCPSCTHEHNQLLHWNENERSRQKRF